MGTFVFLAGFAIGVVVTVLFGVIVNRMPNEDTSDVESRPHRSWSEAQDNPPETASSHE